VPFSTLPQSDFLSEGSLRALRLLSGTRKGRHPTRHRKFSISSFLTSTLTLLYLWVSVNRVALLQDTRWPGAHGEAYAETVLASPHEGSGLHRDVRGQLSHG
jgi:hypothetical protein